MNGDILHVGRADPGGSSRWYTWEGDDKDLGLSLSALAAVQPCTSCLISLSFIFLICTTEMVTFYPLELFWELKEKIHVKDIEEGLGDRKLSINVGS